MDEKKKANPAGWLLLVVVMLSMALAPTLADNSASKNTLQGTALLIFILAACLLSYQWLKRPH